MIEVPRPSSSLVVMGVAGCGKSTLARALGARLGMPYLDADVYHSPASLQKMAQGEPLTDADRHDWLWAMRSLLDEADHDQQPIVLACSALKHAYREILAVHPQRRPVVYICITPEHARSRVAGRQDHFMPPSLIVSQFEALEPPQEAIEVSAQWPLHQAVDHVSAALANAASS